MRLEFSGLNSRRDVAAMLDVDYAILDWHLRRSPVNERYTTFYIPKKSGRSRQIIAPVSAIKMIQQKLNTVLQCVYERKAPAFGFIKGAGILKNAQMHTRKRYVFNLDLKDFFPSIEFKRVKGVFQKPPYYLNSEVSTCLAQICCHKGQLPQGAPTSPIVSNIVCAKLDSELRILANSLKCIYSRYADDITFSTNLKEFPKELAVVNGKGVLQGVGTVLKEKISQNGFSIQNGKVRFQNMHNRQEVTGLVVNGSKPNVKRTYIRELRAMLFAWDRHGYLNAQENFHLLFCKNRSPNLVKSEYWLSVKGKLEFLAHVRGNEDQIYKKYKEKFDYLMSRDGL